MLATVQKHVTQKTKNVKLKQELVNGEGEVEAMTWTAYRIVFRLLSPMHIGWRKVGNLQQTRPYVLGRSLWGALTARLTRISGSNDYSEIGEQVDQQLAFTYFY